MAIAKAIRTQRLCLVAKPVEDGAQAANRRRRCKVPSGLDLECPKRSVNYQLSTVNCQLSTINYQLMPSISATFAALEGHQRGAKNGE